MGSRTRRFGLAAASLFSMYAISLHAQVNVTTYHNDNSRTGQNIQETILTPANVNSSQFGKLFTVTVDGSVYAQPLYLPNVSIGGGTHNVVYVATEHDSVFAIDADAGTIYWQKSLILSGGSTVSSSTDLGCGDISNEVGITGTPVIDTTTGTLYVVAKSKVSGTIYQYLHALDIGTGAEKFGGPANIQASVAGTASDGNGSTVTFSARWENQRAALLLENGHVVIGWSSHCDTSPWHGWLMSYSASALSQEAVYNDSANGYAGGIWMSGSGPAADASGNIFVATGNGSWNTTDRGESILKLGAPANSTLAVLDYFTPYDQAALTSVDNDLSAGGLILLPALANGTQLLTMIGKAGTLYLVNRNDMGQYCVNQSPACTDSDPDIVQEIPNVFSGFWGAPAYWNGYLYWGGGNDDTGEAEPLKAFSFNANGSGLISTSPTSTSALAFDFAGPDPSISANGTSNGILWGLDNSKWSDTCSGGSNCQVLYAYDATNLAIMLYNSGQAANNRDVPGTAVKFSTPTIANGKVYVGSAGTIAVFGLLNGSTSTATAPTLSPGTSTYTSPQSVTITDATPGAAIYYTTNGSIPTTGSAKYSAALTISSTTTVNAIAVASGYTNSAVSSAAYTISSSGTGGTSAPVSLAAAYNVYGIANNGSAVTNGGLDTLGFAYSENLLGSTVTWNGVTFDLGAVGAASGVSGSTIALPSGSYSTLNLLATGVRGDQTNQAFVVTYMDGTTTTITQSLSDWYTPQTYAGESKAVTMAYRVTLSGAEQTGPFYLYGYSFAINSAKTVKSITLPNNRDVVVLAATLSGTVTSSPPPTGTTPVSLASVANIYGMFNNGSPATNGGLDTQDFAYSDTLLGASVTWSGIPFTLGDAGVADAASGVTIPLPAGNFSTLNLLATGVNGNQASQAFVVTYTDGTTTAVTQSLSDWYTPQSYAGESKAVTMAYRLTSTGATDNRAFYLYGYSFPINAAKTVKSITLPANRNVVVLAATLSGAVTTGAAAVALTSAANVYGVFNNGSTVTNGGLDTHSFAYSETLLGTSLTYAGVSYTLLGAGVPDAVSGGTVTLPAGQFSTLNLLATAVNGNQASQTFVVTYTDGTTTTLAQSLSDWYAPQSYAGESKALVMAYRLTATGATDNRTFNLYEYSLAINNAKRVKSVTLPTNRDVVVLAMTLAP
jgi:hypothetical protein